MLFSLGGCISIVVVLTHSGDSDDGPPARDKNGTELGFLAGGHLCGRVR